MKIKYVIAGFVSLMLMHNSLAMPIFGILGHSGARFVEHAGQYGQIHAPHYYLMRIAALSAEAEKLANEGQYVKALEKINQAIDYYHRQEKEYDKIATWLAPNEFDDVLFKLHSEKVRYLIWHHETDAAKQLTQQILATSKANIHKSKAYAETFYDSAHQLNQIAYLFTDYAEQTAFAKQIRTQIQEIFDDALIQYPDLKQFFAYNNACLAAMRGDTHAAIELLNLAHQANDYLSREKIWNDRDFEAIRETPQFQAWLKSTFDKKVKSRKRKKSAR